MMQIIVFAEDTVSSLQNVVNRWLKDNPGVQVRYVTQSESVDPCGDDQITYTIMYEMEAADG